MEFNKLPNHIEEYFQNNSDQHISKELMEANENVDIKTEANIEEIICLNAIETNGKILESKGLKNPFAEFTNKYMRLKISHERKSRTEFVDINKKDFSQDSLNKFANMKTLIDTKS